MPRTLRMQVLAIAVLSIAVVLGVSDWLAARLSEEELRADLADRVRIATDRIPGAAPDAGRLEPLLSGIVLDNRDVAALEVWVRDREWRLLATTRETGRGGPPSPPEIADARHGHEMQESIVLPGGGPGARFLRPVELAGGLEGLVRADVSLEAWGRLRSRLRLFDVLLFFASIALLAFAMDLFFRKRVEPRIARLTEVMAGAAEGRYDGPIAPLGAVELDSLASSLNAMLLRVRELTQGLEDRVSQATEELAARNRDLEESGEELRELQAQALRSERFAALGQTVATLAHELGTPLNSVLGYAQLLKQDAATPEQTAKLDVIESQVRRMIETIRRMLSHTRRGAVEREPVDVSRLVDEVLTLVSPQAEEKGIHFATEIRDGLEIVEIDPIAVRQVMVNLINNALDAGGTTRVTMRVGAHRGSPRGEELEIEVRDDGSGIPKEEQENIWRPFYTTKDAVRGTGLGLAIVDHLVRAHAGHVAVESAPGAGTTFRVRFPCGGES